MNISIASPLSKRDQPSATAGVRTVVILGFEDCLPSGLVGLVDLFWMANQANLPSSPVAGQIANFGDVGRASSTHAAAASATQFRVITASENGHALRDGMGRSIAVDAAVQDIGDCDAVLIPGLIRGASGIPKADELKPVVAWLRQRHQQGSVVAGSCAGVFVLGESGLLDRRRCTTTWWLHEELTRRYPRADAVWGSALIDDDGVVSAGGPMSWIDMALHMIRRLGGAEVAKRTADFAVLDNPTLTQATYAPKRFVRDVDALLLNAEQAVRQAPVDMTATQLARSLALSERTLHRRLKALTGEAPKAFITRTRLEMAKALLDVPRASIKRTGQVCGYGDEASFRRAFAKFAGMSPSAYRDWVAARQA